MHPCRNIAIVGYMGAGKTTAGRICASMLGMEFVDIDAVVERGASHSIAEIFAVDGESEFRRMEAAAVQSTVSGSGLVIATGGGVVVNPESRALLRATCFCIWLRVSIPEVCRRLGAAGAGRPLWSGLDTEMEARWREREPLYRLCAHAVVDTDDLTAEGAARILVQLWSASCGETATSAPA